MVSFLVKRFILFAFFSVKYAKSVINGRFLYSNGMFLLCYNPRFIQVGQTVAAYRVRHTGRKVRAPQSRMPANGRARKRDGKWNRKQYRRRPPSGGTGKGEKVR